MNEISKKNLKRHTICFRTSDQLFKRITEMVKKEKLPRSALCEQLMWMGVAALERSGNKIIN